MSAQHTPGPWHVGIKQAEQIVYTKNGWAVANATVYHGKQDKDEAKANARLIAEAPAMLVALRFFLGGDDKVQVGVGGNPTYVDRKLDEFRAILARIGETE